MWCVIVRNRESCDGDDRIIHRGGAPTDGMVKGHAGQWRMSDKDKVLRSIVRLWLVGRRDRTACGVVMSVVEKRGGS